MQNVSKDQQIEPLQLRVLTQCIKCLATFCTYSWPIRETCHTFGVLEHCIGVLEKTLEDDEAEMDEDLESKVDFNVKAILRLACNMVTGAPELDNQTGDIQGDCLRVVTSSAKFMKSVGERADDENVIVPFLVFLFNSMTKRLDLREYFVKANEAVSGI